jgi:hypothetical protein
MPGRIPVEDHRRTTSNASVRSAHRRSLGRASSSGTSATICRHAWPARLERYGYGLFVDLLTAVSDATRNDAAAWMPNVQLYKVLRKHMTGPPKGHRAGGA